MNVDMLREMLDEMGPELQEVDEKRLGPDALAAIHLLDPVRQQRLKEFVARNLVETESEPDKPPGTADGVGGSTKTGVSATSAAGAPAPTSASSADGEPETLGSRSGATPTAPATGDSGPRGLNSNSTEESRPTTEGGELTGNGVPESQPELTEQDREDLGAIFGDDHFVVGKFVKEMQRAMIGPQRGVIFRNSLLAMAIGAFEVLIAGVVAQYFIQHRGALGSDSKEFSLEDLRDFDDLNDATDYLLSKRVSNLMHGGFDEWCDWFKKSCKADLTDYAMDFEAVREAFQRRHVVIHNGGLVSSEYVAKVVHSEDPPAVGTRLDVSPAYLRAVFDELDVLGTALGTNAWGTWTPDERDASASELLNRSYDLMLMERWGAVRKLTSVGATLTAVDGITIAMRCNHWLSRQRLDGVDSIRAEVEGWDTSALAGRFQLVQLVLLEHFDAAVDLLPELTRANEVTWGELQEWPILQTLREHSKFATVSTALAPKALEARSDA